MIPYIIHRAAIEGDLLEAYDGIETILRYTRSALPEVAVHVEEARDALWRARMALDDACDGQPTIGG